jgi:3-oxoacyl-[acyl-carrier protein] reductase
MLKGSADMFRLDGRIALVTGGSRGIGRACCEALALQGATVIVNYVRGEAAARQVADTIAAKGGKAQIAGFDVADSNAVAAAVDEIVKSHGKVDILIANAGIAIDGLLMRLRDEDLEKLWSTNVRGALACARATSKSMMRGRWGRIVFISSVVGEMGNEGQTGYAASNVVAPGYIDTDMTAYLSADLKEQAVSTVPLGRTGTAAEVAAACVYLASEEAAYVTGQVLRVNGGMYV